MSIRQVLKRTLTTTTKANFSTVNLNSHIPRMGGSIASLDEGKPRILVTGATGQIGSDLVTELRSRYGVENVIASDVKVPPTTGYSEGPFMYLDVLSQENIARAVMENRITWVVHLASLLSAVGEKNPQFAMKLNTRGIENVLEVARINNLRVFAPSTIAVFGESTPKVQTPDETIMRPSTMYGVTKVYLELLGEYYNRKFGVDFRSVRYPGVISSSALPGGGTTDWAVAVFYDAIQHGKYTCFVNKDTRMPMMYSPDSTKAAVDILSAPREKLSQCIYNVTAFDFTPEELFAVIEKKLPGTLFEYAPDFRQAIADSWPQSIDDSKARQDWGWSPSYDIEAMADDMVKAISERYGKAKKQ